MSNNQLPQLPHNKCINSVFIQATVESDVPVEAIVDSVSLATILLFKPLKQIGKKASIPTSALSTNDVVQRSVAHTCLSQSRA